MKLLYFFFPLILCISPLSAKDYWKHREQQGKVGACHTFATLALVEAEYWLTTGKHINLSERELFIRHYTRGFKEFNELVASQLLKATQAKLPTHYKESGHIADDFKLLKQYGATSEREFPYNPTFRNGLTMSMKRLRHQRDALSAEVIALKKSHAWSNTVAQQKISYHQSKLRGVKKAFQLPLSTKTRTTIQQWLAHYQLVSSKPETTPLAKSQIIEQLAKRPVAVDVSNFSELMNSKSYTTNYTRHSLVVSHYDQATDLFTIRSSTHKGSTKVSANALSRGTYKLYFLEKS